MNILLYMVFLKNLPMSRARKRLKSVNFDEQIPKKMFQMQITIYLVVLKM